MTDVYLTCPYNKMHRILNHRMPYHLIKCKKQYFGGKVFLFLIIISVFLILFFHLLKLRASTNMRLQRYAHSSISRYEKTFGDM